MSGRVKFRDFLRTFKATYQQIQGLNAEEIELRRYKSVKCDVELFKKGATLMHLSNSFIRYEHAK
jgi:hypothetical protein